MTPDSQRTRRLTAAIGSLTTAATAQMEDDLVWYRELGARERSWVSSIAQAGIAAFIQWQDSPVPGPAMTADVFGAAPRELARVISLEQTVELVRTTIEVVESALDELSEPLDEAWLRESILRFGREIAFSAAEVYARAAEARGAWDARLESLVVDALLRNEVDAAVMARVQALGWTSATQIVVVAGSAPTADAQVSLEVMRRAAAHHQLELLTGMHGQALIALVGGAGDAGRIARVLVPHFGPGAVVHSCVCQGLDALARQTQETLSALAAVSARPNAPRPISTTDLLAERALAGDQSAARSLVDQVYLPLAQEPALLATTQAYLEGSPHIEATARSLFVHPNTVRYRLRRIAEVTGYSPTEPEGAFCLRLALVYGRLQAAQNL